MPTSGNEVALEQLARDARAGCSAAFAELAERVSPALLGYLRRRSPSLQDAEDLRQETLIRVYENLESYDPGRPFTPWLMTIAARLAAARGRGRRRCEALTEEVAGDGPGVALEAERREAGTALWRIAANLLPPAQYTALRLRYVEQKDVRSVAAEMRVGLSHAKVLLFRARQRLMAASQVRALLDAPGALEDDHGLR